MTERSPAFSLYPDKALAGSDHLSPPAFKMYWKALWWIWLHSLDYSSINNDPIFICKRLKISKSKFEKYWIGEIMDPHDPLLRIEGNLLVSNGLRKEARKQKRYSDAAVTAVSARWKKVRSQNDRNATAIHSDSDSGSGCRTTTTVSPPFDDILKAWKELFPDKPQPRIETYRGKLLTRWKTDYFRENWLTALERATESPTLHKESWFSFAFFARNEENYIKMLDRWMAWKDERDEPAKPEFTADEIMEGIT